MNSLTLPSRRAGWTLHSQHSSRSGRDGHAWQDTQRALHALLERLLPGPGPRLPRAVARALQATQLELQQADSAAFAQALATVRADLQATPCRPATCGRALAVVGLALARSLGKTPYNSQYLAAWLILQGRLAEMATGEGKTLAAALAAAVAGLSQVPVHVLTANDYLVQRDSEQLTPFFAALGLRVGCVLTPMAPAQRARAYRCDITFVTAKEVVFDYLKDHLAQGGEHDPRVLRARALQAQGGVEPLSDADPSSGLLPGLHMAIVDEADASLLDEAVMPLILAQPGRPVHAQAYACAFAITTQLQRGRDYQLLPAQRHARLTDSGRRQVDLGVNATAAGALATALAPPQRAHELVQAALAARWLFKREREYTVTAQGVQLIDEVTGRIAQGRQWSTALQQMVELKEGLDLTPPAVPAAQITFQRFFPRYLHLGGMSGTLTEARHELRLLYGVGVSPVPLVHRSRRQWLGETLYLTAAAKWQAVEQAVLAMHASGRPVLVGTDSVLDSAHVSALLLQAGIPHRVLNAVQDALEADCIAQAGRSGAVTVATNMAGRGTDIQLDAAAAAAGGLHLIACMRNRARRSDRQLLGRCARHGDPGSAQRLAALDDLLLQRGLPAWLRRSAAACAPTGRVPKWCATPLLALAQRAAEWQESQLRKQLRLTERQLSDGYGFAGVTE